MQKFADWMERNLVPIAAKIGAQKHMVAMRDGFAAIMPLMVIGGFAAFIRSFPNDYVRDELLAGGKPLHFINDICLNIYAGSLYTMAIFAGIAIAYSLGKAYESDGLAAALLTVGCMLSLMSYFQFKSPATWGGNDYGWMGWQPALYTKWLGGEGLTVAVLVALIATTIFCKLERSGKLNIRLPEGVPPAVSRAFSALLPSAVVMILAGIITTTCTKNGIPDIYWGIYVTVAKPLMGMASSLPFVLLVVFLQQLLWFFGLHGSNVLMPVVSAVFLPLTTENAAAVTAGGKATHLINSQFLDSYVNLGGSGMTIGLLLVLLVRAKSQMHKTVAKVALGPGLFNINEPIVFGLPIVLNPLYIIPFILAPMAAATIAFVLTTVGFVEPCSVPVFWTTPPIFSGFFATGSWQGAATAAICLVSSIFIYLPFVIFADKREVELERQYEAGSSANM